MKSALCRFRKQKHMRIQSSQKSNMELFAKILNYIKIIKTNNLTFNILMDDREYIPR